MNTPSQLRRLNRHKVADDLVSVEWLHPICELLAHRMGNDFSCYRRPTILRRIEKRMHELGYAETEDYVRHLRERPEEQDLLARELLIKVTSFFRNPTAFDALADILSRELLAEKHAHDPLRIWVAGCSSGEEAYSLAILLDELSDQQHKVLDVRIFATDLDPDAIDAARNGLSWQARLATPEARPTCPRGCPLGPQRNNRLTTRNDRWNCKKMVCSMPIEIRSAGAIRP